MRIFKYNIDKMLKIFCNFSIQPTVDLDELKICLENG